MSAQWTWEQIVCATFFFFHQKMELKGIRTALKTGCYWCLCLSCKCCLAPFSTPCPTSTCRISRHTPTHSGGGDGNTVRLMLRNLFLFLNSHETKIITFPPKIHALRILFSLNNVADNWIRYPKGKKKKNNKGREKEKGEGGRWQTCRERPQKIRVSVDLFHLCR